MIQNNSVGAILYGAIEIGAVLGTISITNSTCLSGGNLGNSFGKTSKNSHTVSTWLNFFSDV